MTLEAALVVLDQDNTSAYICREQDNTPTVFGTGETACVAIDGNFNIAQLKALITVIESTQ
jgi:hypothetical protein